MKRNDLSKAIHEAKRFLVVAQATLDQEETESKRGPYVPYGKLSAATKRASLDCAMALRAIRKSEG